MTLSPRDLAAKVAANVITDIFKSVWHTLHDAEKFRVQARDHIR